MPLIYLDVSAAVHRRAGLGRYAESLARALAEQFPGRFALFYNRGAGWQPLAGLEHLPLRSIAAGYKPWRLAVCLGQLMGVGFDRLLPDAALFHATEHLLPPFRHVPTILTVHDLIYRLYPEHHKPLNYYYLNLTMPLYCRRADAIIAVSQSTRRDLIAHYGLDPNKISVVYEAAAPHFRPASVQHIVQVRARYGLPDRFLLHVGTLEPRKNLNRLLDAFRLLRRDAPDARLVLVGTRGWLYGSFFRRLENLGLQDSVQLLGYVPDADLPAVYSAATVCVMPSEYEGFGLPVLEAMACGTPVVCSRAASLPEVGGEAARYFDPLDIDNVAATLRDVWHDEELRREMAQRSLTQAARFSWSRAAVETLAVYSRLLG